MIDDLLDQMRACANAFKDSGIVEFVNVVIVPAFSIAARIEAR